MNNGLGKKFEKFFKENWLKSFPNTFLLRLSDQQSGYYGTSRNLCDYIAYNNCALYLLECKTIKGNTFPLTNLKQYDKLLAKKNIKGVIAGVVLWFYEHDKVLFVPIKTFEKLKENNQKSFNIKMVGGQEYPSVVIPSIKKRTFMDSDYTVLLSMEEDK